MKRLSYLFFTLIMFSCSSLHNLDTKTSVYGTYCYFDEKKQATLPNWTKITLLQDGSFILIVPYMNNGKEVYGKWHMKDDTLSLNTDYSHLDMNFVEKGVQDTGDNIQLNIKVHDYHDLDLSEFLFTMIIDSILFTKDAAFHYVYYDMDSNQPVTIPFNKIVKASGIALINKRGHFIEYYGSMKEHRDEIKRGHLYDLVFMSFGNTYPVLVNDTYLHVSDTLVNIKKIDSINYQVKYVKGSSKNFTEKCSTHEIP